MMEQKKHIRTKLKSREKLADEYVGFNSSDAIYLITPDRFSNADESNDINKKLKETSLIEKMITNVMEEIYKEL